MASPVLSSTRAVYRSPVPFPRGVAFKLSIEALIPQQKSGLIEATVTVDIDRLRNVVTVTVVTRSILVNSFLSPASA